MEFLEKNRTGYLDRRRTRALRARVLRRSKIGTLAIRYGIIYRQREWALSTVYLEDSLVDEAESELLGKGAGIQVARFLEHSVVAGVEEELAGFRLTLNWCASPRRARQSASVVGGVAGRAVESDEEELAFVGAKLEPGRGKTLLHAREVGLESCFGGSVRDDGATEGQIISVGDQTNALGEQTADDGVECEDEQKRAQASKRLPCDTLLPTPTEAERSHPTRPDSYSSRPVSHVSTTRTRASGTAR